MKNGVLILLVIILLASGTAYLLYKNSDTPKPEAPVVTVTQAPSPTEVLLKEGVVEVTLASVPGSQVVQSGTATLKEVGGKVNVSVALTGDKVATPQPIHIHVGTCAKPGDVVYPLTNVVGGKSETTLNVTLKALEAQGKLLINVHKSAAEQSVYTACGELPADLSDAPEPTSQSMTAPKEASPTATQGTGY